MPSLSHPAEQSRHPDDDRAAFSLIAGQRPGVLPPLLRKRADFLAAARALRYSAPGMLLQARNRGDDLPARVGFTCSKKLGNAVTRNRAKRRLREVARRELPPLALPGWDYVLIGRPLVTVSRSFDDLCRDLAVALRKVHRK